MNRNIKSENSTRSRKRYWRIYSLPLNYLPDRPLFKYLKSLTQSRSDFGNIEIQIASNNIIKLKCFLTDQEEKELLVHIIRNIKTDYQSPQTRNQNENKDLPRTAVSIGIFKTDNFFKCVLSETIIRYFSEFGYTVENRLTLGLYLHLIINQSILIKIEKKDLACNEISKYYLNALETIQFNPDIDYTNNLNFITSVTRKYFSEQTEVSSWLYPFKRFINEKSAEKSNNWETFILMEDLLGQINDTIGLEQYETLTLYYFIAKQLKLIE